MIWGILRAPDLFSRPNRPGAVYRQGSALCRPKIPLALWRCFRFPLFSEGKLEGVAPLGLTIFVLTSPLTTPTSHTTVPKLLNQSCNFKTVFDLEFTYGGNTLSWCNLPGSNFLDFGGRGRPISQQWQCFRSAPATSYLLTIYFGEIMALSLFFLASEKARQKQ